MDTDIEPIIDAVPASLKLTNLVQKVASPRSQRRESRSANTDRSFALDAQSRGEDEDQVTLPSPQEMLEGEILSASLTVTRSS